MTPNLIYVHDPLCSWCWAFCPTLAELLRPIPASLNDKRLLGGLAPDSDAPMPDDLRHYLIQTWQRIQEQVPGTEFNFDFWKRCRPRRSTYPACRAVIAARQQDPSSEAPMIGKIQRAYYTEARNPSESAVLVELSTEIGLDAHRFLNDLRSDKTEHTLREEIARAGRLGANTFPTLVLEVGNSRWPIPVNYHNADAMRAQIMVVLDA